MKSPRCANFCWLILQSSQRKRSLTAAGRLKNGSVQQWLKKGSKQPQGKNGQTLKRMKHAKNWWVVTVLRNVESAPAKPFLKPTTPNLPPPPRPQLHFKRSGSPRHFDGPVHSCQPRPQGLLVLQYGGFRTTEDEAVRSCLSAWKTNCQDYWVGIC